MSTNKMTKNDLIQMIEDLNETIDDLKMKLELAQMPDPTVGQTVKPVQTRRVAAAYKHCLLETSGNDVIRHLDGRKVTVKNITPSELQIRMERNPQFKDCEFIVK